MLRITRIDFVSFFILSPYLQFSRCFTTFLTYIIGLFCLSINVSIREISTLILLYLYLQVLGCP